MKKEYLLPATAWLGGIAGFALRRWELATAYDPELKLMRSVPATWLLYILTAVLVATFCLGCRAMGKGEARAWFYDPSAGYAAIAVSGALLLIVGGGLGLRDWYVYGERNVMKVLAFALLIVGGGMAFVAAREAYRGLWNKESPILWMGISFGTLVWLVCLYQQHARQPEVQLYMWQILSAVAIVLALYGQVTLSLEKGGARRTCVYSLLAIVLTPVALADGVGTVFSFVWLGCAVWLTAQSHMLLRAAFDPNRPERMCPLDENEDDMPETDNDLEETNDE